jgi:hypothetical protein
MAGEFRAQGRSIVTLTTAGAALSNNSAAVANATADLDARNTGNAGEDFQCVFELTCQWATVAGILKDIVVAELYLVPLLDGTNLPDIDLTAGASVLPQATYVGPFVATKAPTVNVDARFPSPVVSLMPLLYRPYIQDRSGQAISANWTLKVVSAHGQYT